MFIHNFNILMNRELETKYLLAVEQHLHDRESKETIEQEVKKKVKTMIGDEEKLGHVGHVAHLTVHTPQRVVQVVLFGGQVVVQVDGEVILNAQQDSVRNGRDNEVEAEYDDGYVVRDLIHREFGVFQVEYAILERVHARRLRQVHRALHAHVANHVVVVGTLF